MWTDTHCHLDAPEFGANPGDFSPRLAVREAARAQGVGLCVYPAVAARDWSTVRALAHATGDAYALGIHPLFVPQASEADVAQLDECLHAWRDDPRLVAVGEIGLDYFVPELCTPAMCERQGYFYRAQLRLAQQHGLPVILHVRRSADMLLQALRALAREGRPVCGGIAHAFNGSQQQAQALMDLGFKLGFGGALTFDAAHQLRRLAQTLPLSALVLETDAPDMPPQWLYVNAAQRAAGQAQGINTPAELPRIGAVLAQWRGMEPAALAQATTANAQTALPRLAGLAFSATIQRSDESHHVHPPHPHRPQRPA